jgi:hypothetical protein
MIIINLEPPEKTLIQVPEIPKPTIQVIIVNVEKEPEK